MLVIDTRYTKSSFLPNGGRTLSIFAEFLFPQPYASRLTSSIWRTVVD
jgi:hypothetical protein